MGQPAYFNRHVRIYVVGEWITSASEIVSFAQSTRSYNEGKKGGRGRWVARGGLDCVRQQSV